METPIEKVKGLSSRSSADILAVEEPLEIRLGHGSLKQRSTKSVSVTMRTPGHDFELAAGFLMTEGVVQDASNIQGIYYSGGQIGASLANTLEDNLVLRHDPINNIVCVELEPDVVVASANLQRNFYTTSSCGICGKASLLALQTVCPPRTSNMFSIAAEVIYTLPASLRAAQELFKRTGGLHGAGLFDRQGSLLALREDVGRHNAVDKLCGSEFLADRTPLRDSLLMLSGRASFELLQKAVMCGIPMVVSVGAPSSLAVTVAKRFDITLVGFLRHEQFNIYHGEGHVTGRRTGTSGGEV